MCVCVWIIQLKRQQRTDAWILVSLVKAIKEIERERSLLFGVNGGTEGDCILEEISENFTNQAARIRRGAA